jgi:excisionase family DNA binding protein
MPTTTDPEPVYTAQQLAERFQINLETVRRRVRQGLWPHTRIGPRCYRFTESHIQAILALHDKQPVEHRPSRRRRTI